MVAWAEIWTLLLTHMNFYICVNAWCGYLYKHVDIMLWNGPAPRYIYAGNALRYIYMLGMLYYIYIYIWEYSALYLYFE